MRDKDNDLVVVKANRMIQDYKYTLSKTEMRVVNAIISNINSPKYDTELNVMEFNIKEFCELLGFDRSQAGGTEYRILKNTLRGLSSKTSDYIDFGDYETIVRWIDKPVFEKGSGTVKLKLDDDLKPFLLQANGYIQSKLHYYFDMNSKYSMRLYELLRSWDGCKQKEFSLEELRLSIDATKSSHTQFGKLKQSVLDPAVKEINEHTDLNVSYTTRTRGKKVLSVIFAISKKEGEELNAISSNSSHKEIAPVEDDNENVQQFTVDDYEEVEKTKEKPSLTEQRLREQIELIKGAIKYSKDLTDAQLEEVIVVGEGSDWWKAIPRFDLTKEDRDNLFFEYIRRQDVHTRANLKNKGIKPFYSYFIGAVGGNYAELPFYNAENAEKKGSFDTEDFYQAALRRSYENMEDEETPY